MLNMTSVDLKSDTFSSLIKVTSFANECDKETTVQTENVTTKADATRTTVDLELVGRERLVHLEPESNFATELSSDLFSSAPPFRSRWNQQVD